MGVRTCDRSCRRIAWPTALVALALQWFFIVHLVFVPRSTRTSENEHDETTPAKLQQRFSQLSVPKGGIDNKLVTTSTDPPFHMFVYPDNVDKVISRSIAENGVYEPTTTDLAYKLLPTDDLLEKNQYLAVDLGSNLGYYSLLLASRGVHVISFEASPDTAWLQRSSVALNRLTMSRGSITIIDKGVTDKPSKGRLSRNSESPGMTSFATVDKFDLERGAAGTALDADIQLVRAGDVLNDLGLGMNGTMSFENESPNGQSHNTIFHILKIDVEGFELKALKGLDLAQYKFRHIIMEYFPYMLRGAGTDPPEVLLYMLSHGYKFYEVVGRRVRELREIKEGGTAKGLRDWAIAAEKGKGDGLHVNLFASISVEDLGANFTLG